MIRRFYSMKNAKKFAAYHGVLVEREPADSPYNYRVKKKPVITTRLTVSEPMSFKTFMTKPPEVNENLFNLWLNNTKLKYSGHDNEALQKTQKRKN